VAREIPTNQPLSPEDREYLVARCRQSKIEQIDSQFPPSGSGESADAVNVEDAESESEVPAKIFAQPVDQPLEDNYDSWSVADLKRECSARHLVQDGKKADLVIRLREDDLETDDQED